MTIILGIDPGIKGALALFDKAERRVTVHDMPATTQELDDLLSSIPPVKFAVVEKPYYPKVIGITNAARIAEAYGRIKALLYTHGISANEVRPAEWKAALNLSSNKAASRESATMFFPDDADQWKRAKDDGRAEAALIAWYGMRWAK